MINTELVKELDNRFIDVITPFVREAESKGIVLSCACVTDGVPEAVVLSSMDTLLWYNLYSALRGYCKDYGVQLIHVGYIPHDTLATCKRMWLG